MCIRDRAQVLQAVCRILVALGRIGFQHGLVAGHLNDILGKFVQCPGFQRDVYKRQPVRWITVLRPGSLV